MERLNVERNIVGSILKGARLLDSFTVDRQVVTLQEFTLDTGMNKTTVYRLLQTLVAARWLVRTENGGYRLGAKLLHLGAIARADLDLRTEALPIMQRLVDEFGDTSFLMIPGETGAVTIEAIGGTNPVRIHGVTAGTVLPYHVAAGPTVLAAYLPAVEEQLLTTTLEPVTSQTLTEVEALRARLADVRRDGFAVSVEDYIDEISAVAAPVCDESGAVVGALSLGGPASHFAEPILTRIIDSVVDAAREVSSQMGS